MYSRVAVVAIVAITEQSGLLHLHEGAIFCSATLGQVAERLKITNHWFKLSSCWKSDHFRDKMSDKDMNGVVYNHMYCGMADSILVSH